MAAASTAGPNPARLRPMLKRLLAAAAITGAIIPPASATPPSVSARAYIVVNTDTGEVLAALQPDKRMAMASTTKLMTAIVTMKRGDLAQYATVPAAAVDAGGSTAGLVAGERIRIRDLVTGLMVGSGNDAAVTLAANVGGSVPAFVAMMNREAATLGLKNTHFANPHGLDAPGHYSTVRELVVMGRYAREEYPFIKNTVRNRVVRIPGPGGVGTRRLESENDLLSIDPEADGVKTGHTDDAGYAIVAHATDPDRKMGLYVAMIGEPSRDQRAIDAKRLLDWGFRQYAHATLLGDRQIVIDLPVRDRPNVRVHLVAQAPLAATIKLGDSMTRAIAAPAEITTPARKGQVVGSVKYLVGDRVVGRRKLVLADDVSEPGPFERIRAGFGRLL